MPEKLPMIDGRDGPKDLRPEHREHLRASGIAESVIVERGYYTAFSKPQLLGLNFAPMQQRTPAIVMPIWDTSGKIRSHQSRPDRPRVDDKGEVVKYETPSFKMSRTPSSFDVPPRTHPYLTNPGYPLVITEGIKKGDALVSAMAKGQPFAVIALLGVWNWRGTNVRNGKTALPEWHDVALNGREVFVAFDSDAMTKLGVYRALRELSGYLCSKGAEVKYIYLSAEPGEKVGIDDFLAAGHTLAEVFALATPELREPDADAIAASDPEDVELPLSDAYNAERLIDWHGEDMRYCHPWGKWLIWTGTHWDEDSTGSSMHKAQLTARAMLRDGRAWIKRLEDQGYTPGGDRGTISADDWGKLEAQYRSAQIRLAHAAKSLNNGKLRAMLAVAQSGEGIPVLPDELNRQPWLLPVANGTIDLRTGKLRPHTRDDLLTKCLALDYDGEATCPQWEVFLWKIMGGETDDKRAERLIIFLQRLCGYFLTGDVSEQILPILWGKGSNGKSVLANTLLALLGPYGMKAPTELLMARKGERHPTELADLFGRRLVAAIETEQGRRLNEVLVKELTGSDPIRARRMREDFWQFNPTHKALLATNHRPEIYGTDHAIWRRLKLVPFTITIPDEEQDKQLGDKLLQELPGILTWAVQGCLDWQQDGLAEPEEVTSATETYRQEMNVVLRFIEECCKVADYAKVKSSQLYETYRAWAQGQGEAPLTQTMFAKRLEEMSHELRIRKVKDSAMWWHGIGVPGKEGHDARYEKETGEI